MDNNKVLKFYMDMFHQSYEYLDNKKLIEKINEYIDNGNIFRISSNLGKVDCLFDFIECNLIPIKEMLKNDSKEISRKVLEGIKIINNTKEKTNERNILISLARVYQSPSYSINIEERKRFELLSKCLNDFLQLFNIPVFDDFSPDKLFDNLLKRIKSISLAFIQNKIKQEDQPKYRGYLGVYVQMYFRLITSRNYINYPDSFAKDKKIQLLCDELYGFILKDLDNPYVYNPKFFIFPFDLCRELYNIEVYKSLSKKEIKKVTKYYYLSIFFENYVGSHLENDWNIYASFNLMKGFKGNYKKLHDIVCDSINSYRTDNGVQFNIENIFDGMKIKEDCILESSLYLKSLCDDSIIFNGMEYTPVLANLFKGVEEICEDLIKKLKLDNHRIKDHNPKHKDDYYNFKDDWGNNFTLGEFNYLIKDINNSDIFNNKYNNYNVFEGKVYRFGKIQSPKPIDTTNTEYLFSIFDDWIKNCRNGYFHKDNTMDIEFVDSSFEYTYFIIYLLFEWYEIVK